MLLSWLFGILPRRPILYDFLASTAQHEAVRCSPSAFLLPPFDDIERKFYFVKKGRAMRNVRRHHRLRGLAHRPGLEGVGHQWDRYQYSDTLCYDYAQAVTRL
jgi:hypothetical protein